MAELTHDIPFIYRLFHLYLEPLILVPGGVYLTFVNPLKFIASTVPSPIVASSKLSAATITPVIQELVTNTGGLYLFFGLNEFLVLRFSKDIKIWRAVIFSILCCDIIHLYALWLVAPTGFMFDVTRWGTNDWVNTVILAAGALLRIAFLAGIGVRRPKKSEGEGGKVVSKEA